MLSKVPHSYLSHAPKYKCLPTFLLLTKVDISILECHHTSLSFLLQGFCLTHSLGTLFSCSLKHPCAHVPRTSASLALEQNSRVCRRASFLPVFLCPVVQLTSKIERREKPQEWPCLSLIQQCAVGHSDPCLGTHPMGVISLQLLALKTMVNTVKLRKEEA